MNTVETTSRRRDAQWYRDLSAWLRDRAPDDVDYRNVLRLFDAFGKTGILQADCSLTVAQYQAFRALPKSDSPTGGLRIGMLGPGARALSTLGKCCSDLATAVLQPANYARCGGRDYKVGIAIQDDAVVFTARNRSVNFLPALKSVGACPDGPDQARRWLLRMFHKLYPKHLRDDKAVHDGRNSAILNRRAPGSARLVTPAAHVASGADHAVAVEVASALLDYVWTYQAGRGPQQSWGVKESRVLQGELREGRKRPGLGIAIFATQLAQEYFSAGIDERIDACIEWAKQRVQAVPPHLLLARHFNDTRGRYELREDFRHTLAFAVILARSEREPEYVKQYLELTLAKQGQEGGWPAGEGETVSELFSAIYAIEFLDLCMELPFLDEGLRKRSAVARDLGAAWCVRQVEHQRLWQCDVFRDKAFDSIFATAWVIRRLAPLAQRVGGDFSDVLRCRLAYLVGSIGSALKRARLNLRPMKMFRLEARVASAAAVAARALELSGVAKRNVDTYLIEWRARAFAALREWTWNRMDLATALFLLDSLVEPQVLRECARDISTQAVADA